MSYFWKTLVMASAIVYVAVIVTLIVMLARG